MKHLKHNKKQQGFTLVEVIVVAIIVAALAAVAIPLYNGYVTSSKNNSAANAAGSVASFMGACRNQSGTVDALSGTDTTIVCTAAGVTPSPTIKVPKGVTVTIDTTARTVVGNAGADNQTYHF